MYKDESVQSTNDFFLNDNYCPFTETETQESLAAVRPDAYNYTSLSIPFDKLIIVSDSPPSNYVTTFANSYSQSNSPYRNRVGLHKYGKHVTVMWDPDYRKFPFTVVIVNPWALGFTADDVYNLVCCLLQNRNKMMLASYTAIVDLIGWKQEQISKALYISRTRQINNLKYKGQTTYFGRRKARSQVTVYDKAEEQNLSGIVWTRVERRVRIPKKDRPELLHFLTGRFSVKPFKEVHIVDITKLKRNTRIGKAVHANGIGKAILDRNLSEAERKKLREFAKKPVNQLVDIEVIFNNIYRRWVSSTITSTPQP